MEASEYIIDHYSPVPLRAQVEQFLRNMIERQEYQNGKLLPNEVELAKKLGISRNTFRQAMDKLVYEGLLVRKKGIGTKVNKNKFSTGLDKWLSFTGEMNEKGVEFVLLKKNVEHCFPPKDIARILGITQKTKVTKLMRVKGDQNRPIVLFISYFHPRIGLSDQESFNGTLYSLLEEKYHVIPYLSHEEIGALKGTSEINDILNIKNDVPILYRKRLVCDVADRPVEYCYVYYRSDRFVYHVSIKRDKQ